MTTHEQSKDDQRRGRSLKELTTPKSPFMPPVEEFDGDLTAIELTLRPTVPDTLRQRIKVTRDLAVYGAFCYEFFAVSVNWAYTCVEMALWTKFTEMNPTTPPPATLRPLVDWAVARKLLPPHIPPHFLSAIRNSMAHPREFNHALTPEMTRDTFQMMIDIMNRLWPVDLS